MTIARRWPVSEEGRIPQIKLQDNDKNGKATLHSIPSARPDDLLL